jgi:hypothetical protein
MTVEGERGAEPLDMIKDKYCVGHTFLLSVMLWPEKRKMYEMVSLQWQGKTVHAISRTWKGISSLNFPVEENCCQIMVRRVEPTKLWRNSTAHHIQHHVQLESKTTIGKQV